MSTAAKKDDPQGSLPATKGNDTHGTVPAILGTYAIAKTDPHEFAEMMRENIGGRAIDEFDLDRIKVPSAGAVHWTVPTLEGAKVQEVIEGVVVGWSEVRAYWKVDYDEGGGGSPPDCKSIDSLQGIGTPGGDCLVCPLAQFGSAMKNGKPASGQACRQKRLLFMVREGDLMPIVVVAPAASLADMRKFFLRLSSAGLKYHHVTTKLGLKAEKNRDGKQYAVIVPVVGARLSEADRERMGAYRAAIQPLIDKASTIEAARTDEPAERAVND